MKFKDSFHPYAMTTILVWSFSYVLTRMSLEHFSSPSLALLRYLVASAALIAAALATRMKLPRGKDLGWFALAGGIGFFLYMIIFNKGCETVTSATSSIIIATVPAITALLARIVYKETLHAHQWAAIAIEFTGVLLLTLLKQAFSFNAGVFWLLLASVLLSVYNLLQRKLTKTHTGFQTSTYSILAGTVMLLIFLPTTVPEVKTAPPALLLYAGILGLFCSAVGYVAWAEAFKRAKKASSVSNYMFVTPFLASILGFVIASERPDMPTLAGGAIILIGLVLFNFGDRVLARAAQARLTDKKAHS